MFREDKVESSLSDQLWSDQTSMYCLLCTTPSQLGIHFRGWCQICIQCMQRSCGIGRHSVHAACEHILLRQDYWREKASMGSSFMKRSWKTRDFWRNSNIQFGSTSLRATPDSLGRVYCVSFWPSVTRIADYHSVEGQSLLLGRKHHDQEFHLSGGSEAYRLSN